MNTRKRLVLAALVVAGTLAGAGVASADPAGDLGQAVEGGQATLENGVASFVDALNGPGAEGAEGVESEFPEANPRFVEGPLGGLLNGPFD